MQGDSATSPSLLARRFERADCALLASWFAGEMEIVEWAGPALHWPLDQAQCDLMLSEAEGELPARTLWTVTAASGQTVGHFQLFHDRRRRSARLGRVALSPSMRRQGLAGPLMRLVTEVAFGDPLLHRLELQVYDHNDAAIATYRRAGFKLEGVLRESVPVVSAHSGQAVFWNTILMALLRSEWEAAR